MLFTAAIILTALLVLLTLLPLSRAEVWWVRGADFPRLQLFAAGAILAVTELVLLDLSRTSSWIMIGAVTACMVWQAWWIWPYTFLHRKEVRAAVHPGQDHRIRIMIANVLMTNRNADGLLNIIAEADPDVVVTLETNAWWETQLAVLEAVYPHRLKCPLDNKYGMHLYSRLPLADAHVRFLVEPDHPSMHALVTLRSGQRIRLHCLHPAPPSPTENDSSIERDAELILVGKQVANASLPVLVTGDLNDVAWSATTRLFRKISGLLDPRIGRGMFNSFHAGHFLLRWPLDHLFHSRHFTLGSLRRLPYFGSDHFPIFVELALEPEYGVQQEGLQANPEERAWAEEKINQTAPADKAAQPDS